MPLIAGMKYHKSYSSYEDSYWSSSGGYFSVCPITAELIQFDFGINALLPFFAKYKDGRLELFDDQLKFVRYYYTWGEKETNVSLSSIMRPQVHETYLKLNVNFSN